MIRPPVWRRHQYAGIASFVVVAGVVTQAFVNTEFGLSVVNQWLLYAMAAIGFYLMFCVAGRFAFCQTFMMATGAYTAAYLSRSYPFWIGILGAVAAVVVVAGLFGALVRRTEGFLFAVGTLALAQIGTAVFSRWTGFTGQNGLASSVPLPSPLGRDLHTQFQMFWWLLAMAAVCLVVATFVERSPMARDAVAGRDAPEMASSSGVPVERLQAVMFVVGSALGGLAGALAAYWQGSVSTESFGIGLSIGIFLMPIIGGVGSVWGPVVGALLYVSLPRALSGLERYAALIYGIVLVLAIIAFPQGIVGFLSQVRSAVFRSRRRGAVERVDVRG